MSTEETAEQKEHREKALGQLRLQLNGVMQPFHLYGLSIHVAPAIEEIVKLALQLHERLNGADIPIQVSNNKGGADVK